MGRPHRAVEPNGIYHLTSRGSNRQRIFAGARDRLDFLGLLAGAVERYAWSCVAYCLMTNHYHLVMQIGDAGLSSGMQWLNGGFSRLFNVRHGCSAHLFRNRFASVFIENEGHLLEACRYVVLNPVRAGLCERPEDWRWSSYRASAGLERCPAFLSKPDLLGLFASSPEQARRMYMTFVAEGQAPLSVSDTVDDA